MTWPPPANYLLVHLLKIMQNILVHPTIPTKMLLWHVCSGVARFVGCMCNTGCMRLYQVCFCVQHEMHQVCSWLQHGLYRLQEPLLHATASSMQLQTVSSILMELCINVLSGGSDKRAINLSRRMSRWWSIEFQLKLCRAWWTAVLQRVHVFSSRVRVVHVSSPSLTGQDSSLWVRVQQVTSLSPVVCGSIKSESESKGAEISQL